MITIMEVWRVKQIHPALITASTTTFLPIYDGKKLSSKVVGSNRDTKVAELLST